MGWVELVEPEEAPVGAGAVAAREGLSGEEREEREERGEGERGTGE